MVLQQTLCFIIPILKKSHSTEKEPYVVGTSRFAIKHKDVANFLLTSRISETSLYFTACYSGSEWVPSLSPGSSPCSYEDCFPVELCLWARSNMVFILVGSQVSSKGCTWRLCLLSGKALLLASCRGLLGHDWNSVLIKPSFLSPCGEKEKKHEHNLDNLKQSKATLNYLSIRLV